MSITRPKSLHKLNYALHGDVQIRAIKIPKSAELFDAKNVLAEGEVTGHAHRISSGTVEFLKYQAKTYLRVISQATLTHEEHKPIVLPPGDYEYGITREYSYDDEETKKVAD